MPQALAFFRLLLLSSLLRPPRSPPKVPALVEPPRFSPDKTLSLPLKCFSAASSPPMQRSPAARRLTQPLPQTLQAVLLTSRPISPADGSLSLLTPLVTVRRFCKFCPTRELRPAGIPFKYMAMVSLPIQPKSPSQLVVPLPPCNKPKTSQLSRPFWGSTQPILFPWNASPCKHPPERRAKP